MNAIFKREFKSYFTNMTGVLFIAVLLLFTGVFTASFNFTGQLAAFEYAIENTVIVFLLIVPILTMRSLSEDKRTRTDTLLYSLPLKLSAVVIGKYLAMVAVFLVPVAVMCFYPLILSAYGTVSFVGAYASLFGFFLLGAALIAICMFMSSLTESQVIAAVTGFGVVLLLYFMDPLSSMIPSGETANLVCFLVLEAALALLVYYVTRSLRISLILGGAVGVLTVILFFLSKELFAGTFGKMLGALALFDRFNEFSYGLFDLSTILYYLSFIVFFVFLTVMSLDKKRWN